MAGFLEKARHLSSPTLGSRALLHGQGLSLSPEKALYSFISPKHFLESFFYLYDIVWKELKRGGARQDGLRGRQLALLLIITKIHSARSSNLLWYTNL